MWRSDKRFLRRGQIHLYLQKCGWPRRLWPGCPLLGSLAAARLLLGFCSLQPEAQTVSVRKRRWSFTLFAGCVSRWAWQRGCWFNQRRFTMFVSHHVRPWSLSLFLPFLHHSVRRNLTWSPQTTSVTCSHELRPIKRSTRLPPHINVCWLLNSSAAI